MTFRQLLPRIRVVPLDCRSGPDLKSELRQVGFDIRGHVRANEVRYRPGGRQRRHRPRLPYASGGVGLLRVDMFSVAGT